MTDSSDLLLLRRAHSVAKRLDALHRENALEFFEPHHKQCQFYENSSYRFRYARTGNRFGKSEMGAAEDVAFALGYRPWYPVGHVLRTLGIPTRPTKGLIVTTDWDKSSEIFTEGEYAKLVKYIPKTAWLDQTRNHSGAIDQIEVRHISGGISTIALDTVKSFKQNPLGQESSSWDWVHIDEPIPESMWKAIVRGLTDRGGRAWFTCTPITEPWIDAQFVPDLESQSRDIVGSIADDENSRWMMTGSMDDNPHLTPEDIRLTLSWYTEEERESRRNGIPAAYSGIVYKEFSFSDHVLASPPVDWTDWSNPPPTYTLRFAIDYHPRKPHHVLFIATSPLDVQYVYAEIHLSCLMHELVAEIKRVLGGRESTVPGLIDPLASTPNRVTDITPLEEVLRLGLPVMPATKDPHNGILATKAWLKQRDRHGRPMMFVRKGLSRFLFEISRGYVWDGDTNKPLKVNDDAMENFYRLCLQGLSYIEPASPLDYLPIRDRDLPTNVIDLSDFSDAPAPRKSNASRYRKS